MNCELFQNRSEILFLIRLNILEDLEEFLLHSRSVRNAGKN